MALSEKELEKELLEAGNALLSPPSLSPVTELLALLDRVEKFLIQVEQSPSESMNKALSPSKKALIAGDLLRHSDVDVKVYIASCISEITRITAPDAPYEDDQMKEIFQLIVSSFEKLDDINSLSYIKRTTILETVAKVRSCVVMLDLECDSLIAEMFQHFLRSIREHHTENIFSSMETIMTLVLEESEDISVDLLASVLDFLKIQDNEVLPIARQLAEKVIEKCANKVKLFLLPAVKSRGASVDDYNKVVANILGPEAVEPSVGDAASEDMSEKSDQANTPTEKPVEVAMETLDDAPPSEEVDPTTAASPKSVMSNGNVQKEIEDTCAVIDDSKDDHEANDESKSAEEPSNINAEILTVEESAKSEPNKPEITNKQKGRKASSSKNSSEPSEPSLTEIQEAIKKPVEQTESKDVDSLHSKDTTANAREPSETDKESDHPVSSPKISENEKQDESDKESDPPVSSPKISENEEQDETDKESNPPVSSPKIPKNEEQDDTPSPSPSRNIVDEKRSKKDGQAKKTEDPVQETELAGEVDFKKESDTKNTKEGADLPETKSQKQTGKKASHKGDNSTSGVASKNEDEETPKLDAKSAKQSGKKVETLSSQREDNKKKGHVKGTPAAKDLAKTPDIDEGKKPGLKSTPKLSKDVSVEKASKSSSKRKQSPAKGKASKTKGYGAEYVGSKIKVWWPADKAYYEGFVESFDSVTLKHKIVYTDGDIEVLKLTRQRWALVDDDSPSDQGHASDAESLDESVETPKRKKVKTSTAVKKSGTSSSKSKQTPKSSQKQKGDNKTQSKAKEQASKSTGKSDHDKAGKSKSSTKSKDDDVVPTKGSSKSNQETPKGTTKSKGKSPKANSKSNTNGTGKGKATSTSTEEEAEYEEESSPEPVKAPEPTKGKSPSASKSQKSGKKRKRGRKG